MNTTGWASGGFLANSRVRGVTQGAGQQQWFARDSALEGGWQGGSYNMVFVGATGGTLTGGFARCGAVAKNTSCVVADAAGRPAVEKPFVTIDDDGRYYLVRPAARVRSADDAGGPTWALGARDTRIPFERVYVADNRTDTAATINAKLGAGKHVVLAPGVFSLDAPLRLTTAGQVCAPRAWAAMPPHRGGGIARRVRTAAS